MIQILKDVSRTIFRLFVCVSFITFQQSSNKIKLKQKQSLSNK